jgi:hypothetical protein
MHKKLFYIYILMAVFLFAGCAESSDPVYISVDETPEREYVSQEVTATPSPSPTPTAEPTPEPTPEEFFDYIENLELEEDSKYLFIGAWDFQDGMAFSIGEQSYNKGIGMYVRSKDIKSEKNSISAVWYLEKDYHKISFDLGCESNLQYGAEGQYGTYQVTVYADDTLVWDSGQNDYQYTSIGQEVDIPEDSTELTVTLTETKGVNGTLNIVMGSFKLYYYE